jgi:hypothetical protein
MKSLPASNRACSLVSPSPYFLPGATLCSLDHRLSKFATGSLAPFKLTALDTKTLGSGLFAPRNCLNQRVRTRKQQQRPRVRKIFGVVIAGDIPTSLGIKLRDQILILLVAITPFQCELTDMEYKGAWSIYKLVGKVDIHGFMNGEDLDSAQIAGPNYGDVNHPAGSGLGPSDTFVEHEILPHRSFSCGYVSLVPGANWILRKPVARI